MLQTVIVFLIVTGLVSLISWIRTKDDDLSTSKGYFLAGRGLSAFAAARCLESTIERLKATA